MTEEKKSKKISRRDAIKLLGAVTGATVLANLPSKWKTPEIASGVLPAHAQTSSLGLSIQSCNLSVDITTGAWSTAPFIVPIPLPQLIGGQFTLTLTGAHFVGGTPSPFTSNWTIDPSTGSTIHVNSTNNAGTMPGPIALDNGATSGSFSVLWEFTDPSIGTGTCSQTVNWALPTVQTVSIIPLDNIPPPSVPQATFTGNVSNEGSSPVTMRGFLWSTTIDPILPTVNSVTSGSGAGMFTANNIDTDPPNNPTDFYGRAYATNAVGTAYGISMPFQTGYCLVEGTLIIMADGSTKRIEDIDYSDWIRVWNFDEGKFDQAQPLWIMQANVARQYLAFEFSDGSVLKNVIQHRIFNKEKGMFTYPMSVDAPIGTTTFNANGEDVTLVGMRAVNEEVEFYNVITNRHINLFANGILTSCRYNNIYPIVDMKFVKDDRELISKEQYEGISDEYYEGLRLAEQNIPIEKTFAYVNRLELKKASKQELVSEKETNFEQFEAEPVL